MIHDPKPFPDKEEFATWIASETGLKKSSAKDVTSRLNILRRHIPDAEQLPVSELRTEIQSLVERGEISKPLGTGMMRALKLYRQFQSSLFD